MEVYTQKLSLSLRSLKCNLPNIINKNKLSFPTTTTSTFLSRRCLSTTSPTRKGLLDIVKPGIVTGDKLVELYDYAKSHGFAIPAVNCVSSSSVNAVLEAAKEVRAPIIIQFSNGGAAFYAGKSIKNSKKKQEAAVAGAVAGALHVRQMAKFYGVPVVLHTDHCARNLLPWLDGVLVADEEYFSIHGEPLFSSHMIDLSAETKENNLSICTKYFERMARMNQLLEMEIGITGGEEDGVDNTHTNKKRLYTPSEEVWYAYEKLSSISPAFTIAAAFGNVHGVYKPGNVKLRPELLGKHQSYIRKQLGITNIQKNPVSFVFHGGSGSSVHDIHTALKHGIVKMNVDTDTQWAYWSGVHQFYNQRKDYLQDQIGNPTNPDAPNKKYYDPRTWLREGEKSMMNKIKSVCKSLKNVNVL